MKWNDFEMEWGRPLKSILSIFDNKKLSFKFYHLESSNFTFVDKEFEDKKKIFKNFSSYNDYFNNKGIILDQNERRILIEKQLQKISERKNVNLEINVKLLNEVVDLVDQPHILVVNLIKNF